jgi:hypothetical protein
MQGFRSKLMCFLAVVMPIVWALVMALALAPLLAACGGGGGSDAPAPGTGPVITGFASTTTRALVGERATLVASFSGGQGRIEPGVGPVTSGVAITTPVLTQPVRYTLVVEGNGTSTRRELALDVQFRDRYEVLPERQLQYHAAVAAADGSVLVFGGSRGENVVSDAIDRFDPATRTFSRIGTLRTGRFLHSATRITAGPAQGQVLVLGGGVSVDIGAVADLVDERTGAVSDGGQLQQPRARHAVVALADGRALVVGGANRNTVELWDPATRSFRLVTARMRHVREWPTATLLADGRVLIAGGDTIATEYVLAEIFNPANETFTPVETNFTERRALHTAHRTADGRVLLVGGEVADAQGQRLRPLASVLQFDPATGQISARRELDVGRSLAAAVDVGATLLLFGGTTPTQEAASSATAWRDDAAPRTLAPLPAGRIFHTATRMGDGRVLILGGDTATGDPVKQVLIYE